MHALRQRRVAAGEHQAEALVSHRTLIDRLAARVQQRGLGVAVLERGLEPEAVDRAIFAVVMIQPAGLGASP
jgi:hypothetical protein